MAYMLLIRRNWIFRTSDNLILLPTFLLVIQTFFLLCHNLQLVLFLYNLQLILQFLITVYGIIGYPYDNIVRFVLSKCNLYHIHKTDTSFCSACCFGKIHKFPFSSSEIIYTNPLKVVHSDLWGPTPHQSSSDYKYYIHFIDEFSRFTWIYMLRNKSDALQTFIHFKT